MGSGWSPSSFSNGSNPPLAAVRPAAESGSTPRRASASGERLTSILPTSTGATPSSLMQSPRVSSPGLSGSSFAIAPCEDM